MTNRIKELRTGLMMKQEELARRCGVKQGAVSAWENGTSNPKPEALRIMSDIFGVPIGYILGADETGINSDLSGIDFALSGEIRELTDAEKQDLLDYVRFKRAQKAKQEGKP